MIAKLRIALLIRKIARLERERDVLVGEIGRLADLVEQMRRLATARPEAEAVVRELLRGTL